MSPGLDPPAHIRVTATLGMRGATVTMRQSTVHARLVLKCRKPLDPHFDTSGKDPAQKTEACSLAFAPEDQPCSLVELDDALVVAERVHC